MAAPAEAESRYEPNGINTHTGEVNGTASNIQLPVTNGGAVQQEVDTAMSQNLSSDEMALYDRQIRLWGAQAQQNIKSANVLLVSLRALGTEIAKNLTLAGINSLTIVDDEPITEDDLGAQFFLREDDIGKPRGEAALPRIQELNPRVRVSTDGGLKNLLAKNQFYYSQFECVIACDHDIMTLSAINAGARVAMRPFYAAGIHGFYGYIFADLVMHEFIVERDLSNKPTTIGMESLTRSVVSTSTKETNGKTVELVRKLESYCPLILANTSPLPADVLSVRRKLKGVPPLLPCLRALFEFERDYQRLPGLQQQDLATFTTLATNKSRELQLPQETLRADFLRSFIQNIGSEITPTAAFVGGRLSEDVINVLGKREQPIQNFVLFDGEALDGRIYSLYTMPPEMEMLSFANTIMPSVNGALPVPNVGTTDSMPMDTGALQPSLTGQHQQVGQAPQPAQAQMPDNQGAAAAGPFEPA